MPPDPSDPLGLAEDDGAQRAGSASKMPPDPSDPIGLAEDDAAQRAGSVCKRSPGPPGSRGEVRVDKSFVRA